MVEMEQQMWREGDLFRAQQKDELAESSSVDGVSSRMGNLALAAAPDSKRSKRVSSAASAKAPTPSKTSHSTTGGGDEEVAFGLEGKEGGTTQGDLLRASRTKNARVPSSPSGLGPGPSWDRSGSRLTRK